jgi:hypothetical protein
MSAQPAQFTLPFTHYASLGYNVCPTAGKVPSAGVGWYDRTYSPAELGALDVGDYNVGLRCNNVVGLDIDVPDAALAAEVERVCRTVLKLPKSTPIRVGSAPKRLLVVRVNDPTRGWDIKVPGRTLFQLLGQGKQFVIHGTHPETHKPYTLSAPLPKWSSLKLVDEHDLLVLRKALLDLFEKHGHPVRADGPTGKKGTGQWSQHNPWTEQGMKLAQEALATLDPDMAMNDWVKVGFAIHDGTHGSAEGLWLWDEWSSGGEKYKEGDCSRRWRGFESGGATTAATLFKNDFPKVSAGSRHEPAVRVESSAAVDSPGLDGNALLDFEAGEVPWVVQDVLTYGAHLLVGRPKGGKSWITLDMAYACANGGMFLGKQARKCGVLWISGEDTKASLSRRLKVRNERFSLSPIVMTVEALKAERAQWEDCSFDAWLRGFLEAHPAIGLVIMDTHSTIEALWAHEQIDVKRQANIVEQAYQKSRLFEDIGQMTETCIVLVHHAAKRKGKEVVDYHELINLPATVVAGSTASLVLADPPDRDIHDPDDNRRIFAVRGRHIIGEAPLLIELKDARATLIGEYHEVRQTETQAEVLETAEALLREQGWPTKEAWTTYREIAKGIGKHEKTVAYNFKVMKKDPLKMVWKGYYIVLKQSKGMTLLSEPPTPENFEAAFSAALGSFTHASGGRAALLYTHSMELAQKHGLTEKQFVDFLHQHGYSVNKENNSVTPRKSR